MTTVEVQARATQIHNIELAIRSHPGEFIVIVRTAMVDPFPVAHAAPHSFHRHRRECRVTYGVLADNVADYKISGATTLPTKKYTADGRVVKGRWQLLLSNIFPMMLVDMLARPFRDPDSSLTKFRGVEYELDIVVGDDAAIQWVEAVEPATAFIWPERDRLNFERAARALGRPLQSEPALAAYNDARIKVLLGDIWEIEAKLIAWRRQNTAADIDKSQPMEGMKRVLDELSRLHMGDHPLVRGFRLVYGLRYRR